MKAGVEKLEDTPEVLLIEGDYGSGKTALGAVLLDEMIDDETDRVYSNACLHTNAFRCLKSYYKLEKINYATFLNIKEGSVALLDEIHKVFDKREALKNVKKTQSLQEIRKFGYKLIGTAHRANMLDFRFLRTTCDIIRAWGNMELILKFDYALKIHPEAFLAFSESLTEENHSFLFLYELRRYNEEESFSGQTVVDRTGRYFVMDIRNAFKLYDTHEKIQKMTFLNNFMEEKT